MASFHTQGCCCHHAQLIRTTKAGGKSVGNRRGMREGREGGEGGEGGEGDEGGREGRGGRAGRDRRAGLRSTTFWQPIIGRFPTILLVVVLGLNQDHKPLLIAAQIQRMRCQCHGCQHCWRIGSVVCGFPSPSIIPKFVCSHRRLTTSL
jgi:hypothetical protein